MALYETEALVIKKTDYGEADRLVVLYTKDYGKIRAIVKGIRKPSSKFNAITELFTYLKVILYFAKEKQEFHRLIRGDVIAYFNNIRIDLRKLTCCSCIFELLNYLTPDREADLEMFYLIIIYLETLDKGTSDELSLTLIYLLRLLQKAGFGPNLSECVSCGLKFQVFEKKSKGWNFNLNKGGLICSDCLTAEEKKRKEEQVWVHPISKGMVQFLRASLLTDLKDAHKLKIERKSAIFLLNLLFTYIERRLELDLKSVLFLRKLYQDERYPIYNNKKR